MLKVVIKMHKLFESMGQYHGMQGKMLQHYYFSFAHFFITSHASAKDNNSS